MRILLLVLVVVVAGCQHEVRAPGPRSPAAAVVPSATKAQDALWALAPEATRFGFVASPHGVAMLERGLGAFQKLLGSSVDLAAMNGRVIRRLFRATGSTNPTLAEFGLSPDKGFATFVIDDHAYVVVLPVADRSRFLAKVRGKRGADHDEIDGDLCKLVRGLYVCVARRDQFDQLGHPGRATALRAAAAARGDLEFTGDHLGGAQGPSLSAVAELAPGSITVRGTIRHPPGALARLLGAPARPRTSAAGFGVVALAPLLRDVPPAPIAANVTLTELARTIAGPATFAIPDGTTGFDLDLRIPLRDPAPARAVLEACDRIPALARLFPRVEAGTCRLRDARVGLTIDAWIEGNELRVGQQHARAPSAPVAMSPLAAAIAGPAWSLGMYGRGSFLSLAGIPTLSRAVSDETVLGFRALALLNELGVGVRREGDTVQFLFGARTAWTNPDAVLDKLIAIPLHGPPSAAELEQARAIAAAAPASPFAADLKTGISGATALLVPIGVVAGIALAAVASRARPAAATGTAP